MPVPPVLMRAYRPGSRPEMRRRAVAEVADDPIGEVARVTGQALGLGVHSASDWTVIWTSGYLHPYPEAAVVDDDIRAGLDSCRQAVQPCPDLAAGSQIAPWCRR